MTVSEHYSTATLIPADADPIILEGRALDVTLDEGWSPFVQGTLKIPLPDVDTIDLLDARDSPRLRLNLTQVYGDSDTCAALTAEGWAHASDVTTRYTGKHAADITRDHYRPFNSSGVRAGTRANLAVSVRSREIDYDASTVTITFASDEALLDDYALIENAAYVPPTFSVREIVGLVLSRIGAVLLPGTADGTIAAGSNAWTPGQTAWDFLTPLVQQAALRLWCDGKQRWHLEPDTFTESGHVTLTATGTVTQGTDTITRDGEWFDAVVVTYKWTDALGLSYVAYDSAAEDDFTKVKTITYTDTVYPGAGAAQRILSRRLSVGRQQSVRAISSYAAMPSQAISVSLPDAPTQTGFVKSVHWTIDEESDSSDEMDIESRGLTEASIYAWSAAVGAWTDQPVGRHWTAYTP